MSILQQLSLLFESILSGNYSIEQLIDVIFIFQVFALFFYLISAFLLIHNGYVGLIALYLGIILLGFLIYAYRTLRMEITRTSYGIVLGGSFILIFILLESAIFWGQSSGCRPTKRIPTSSSSDGAAPNQNYLFYGVDCVNIGAMESLCTFSVLLFLSYLILLAVMIKNKHEILGSAPVESGSSGGGYGGRGGYRAVPTNLSIPSFSPLAGTNPIYNIPPTPPSQNDG